MEAVKEPSDDRDQRLIQLVNQYQGLLLELPQNIRTAQKGRYVGKKRD